MSLDHRFFRPLGVLSIIASLPIMEAGVMAARAFFQSGDHLRMLLSSAGAVGALFLLIGGILLCAKRTAGRTVCLLGAGVCVPTHICGALIGLMGGHALLYGVGYPIVIVQLLNRATPSNGAPVAPESSESPSTKDHPGHLRSATV